VTSSRIRQDADRLIELSAIDGFMKTCFRGPRSTSFTIWGFGVSARRCAVDLLRRFSLLILIAKVLKNMFKSYFRRPALSGLLMTGLCLFLGGCGGPVVPELYSVSGKVTYQGKPVPKAKINFIPVNKEDAKKANLPGDRAGAETDENGEYVVFWGSENEGAPAGKYMITIVAFAPYGPNDDTEVAPPSLIPKSYSDPKTSGLTREVKEQDNTFNFDLTDDGAAAGASQGPRDE
jgi:hypothetical protein